MDDPDPDDYFHTLRAKERVNDAVSPAPRQPTMVAANGTLPSPPLPTTGFVELALALPRNTSLLLLYSLVTAPWIAVRVTVVSLVIVSMMIVSLSQRALFDATSTSPLIVPSVIVVAMTTAKALIGSLLLVCAHASTGVGVLPERSLYGLRIPIAVGTLSLLSTTCAVYGVSALPWELAVVFNPFALSPLFFVLSARVVGKSLKRLPWTSVVLVCLTLGAVCLSLLGKSFHGAFFEATSATTTEHQEGALDYRWGCVLAVASGGCGGIAMSLLERYHLHYPTTPLLAHAASHFVELLMLPLVFCLEWIPYHFPNKNNGASVVDSLSSIHENVPTALIGLCASYVGFGTVVVPLVTRCPALLVPIFALAPLLSASLFPGPGLAVAVGGAFAFFTIVMLLTADSEYDEDRIAVLEKRVSLWRPAVGRALTWRHGCSVLMWRVLEPVDPIARENSSIGYALRQIGILLGWMPVSTVYTGGCVRYSDGIRKHRALGRGWGSNSHRGPLSGFNDAE